MWCLKLLLVYISILLFVFIRLVKFVFILSEFVLVRSVVKFFGLVLYILCRLC